MKLLLLFILLGPLVSKSAEVDHFLALDQEIKDSRNIINKLLHNQAKRSLNKINRKLPENYSCEEVFKEIKSNFKNGLGFKVNKYIRYKLSKEYKYPGLESKKELVRASIFKDNRFFSFLPVMEDVINYNGIYIGVDKFSHFFAMGQIFYKKFLRYKKQNLPNEEITKKLLDSGAFSEKTYLGMIGTKTFSYGDLESNYQGFLFLKSFCHGDSPLLIFKNGKWKLKQKISLDNYINPYWNEFFNPNAFTKKFLPQVKKRARKYCPLIKSTKMLNDRLSYYSQDKWEKSEAQKYYELKRDQKEIPDNSEFELHNLCSL